MNKPYIISHRMTAVAGRIDCAMTEHLPGVQEYYETLDALAAPTCVSGRAAVCGEEMRADTPDLCSFSRCRTTEAVL